MRIYRLLSESYKRMMRDDTVVYRNPKGCVDNYFHKVNGKWTHFQPMEDGIWAINGIIFKKDT